MWALFRMLVLAAGLSLYLWASCFAVNVRPPTSLALAGAQFNRPALRYLSQGECHGIRERCSDC